MRVKGLMKYLLSVEEFMEPDGGNLLEEAFSKVDPHRRQRAEGLRPGRAQAACLGAGLVLQLAAWELLEPGGAGGAVYSEALGDIDRALGRYSGSAERRIAEETANFCEEEEGGTQRGFANRGLIRYTVSGLLDRLRDKEPLPLAFRYGEKGKPYFRDYPVYFNLSHSGDYVLCALAMEEVGADIQQHRTGSVGRIAARYFSEQEKAALENRKEGGEELFFRLWTRKEAYGKLTGEGIAGTMGINLLPEACGTDRGGLRFDKGIEVPEIVLGKSKRIQDGRELVWEEYRIPGYSISICYKYKTCDYV